MTDLAARRVAPFGDPGITARVQLPQAYRSLPRPSSPLDAKASTVCLIAFDLKFVRTTPIAISGSAIGDDSSHRPTRGATGIPTAARADHIIHPSVVKERKLTCAEEMGAGDF